jgi:hypothetical protein
MPSDQGRAEVFWRNERKDFCIQKRESWKFLGFQLSLSYTWLRRLARQELQFFNFSARPLVAFLRSVGAQALRGGLAKNSSILPLIKKLQFFNSSIFQFSKVSGS